MAKTLNQLQITAERLQKQPTKSEQILREYLVCQGYDFAFNEPLYGYIPDFYFKAHKLIIELDGQKFHDRKKDAERDAFFRSKGIRTHRFPSAWVFSKFNKVINAIQDALEGNLRQKLRRTKERQRKDIINALLFRERPVGEIDELFNHACDKD